MDTYKVREMTDGTITITTSAAVREQQGSWRWQIRLCTAFYRAAFSRHLKCWLWKSYAHSRSFSGGNIRSGGWTGDGSRHNQRLTATELWALQVARGEI